MKEFECDSCGVRINSKAILEVFPNEMVGRDEIAEELSSDRPYFECHNDDCEGVLFEKKRVH